VGLFSGALSLKPPPGFSDVEFLLDMVSPRAGEEKGETKRRMEVVVRAFEHSTLPLLYPPPPETS
jgi:hypothetical protein